MTQNNVFSINFTHWETDTYQNAQKYPSKNIPFTLNLWNLSSSLMPPSNRKIIITLANMLHELILTNSSINNALYFLDSLSKPTQKLVINTQTYTGLTASHLIIKKAVQQWEKNQNESQFKGYEKAATLFITRYNADPTIKDNEHYSCIDYANNIGMTDYSHLCLD